MTRRMMMAMTVATLLFGAARLLAHDEVRVIGTITKHKDSTIEVKDTGLKTTAIRLDKHTTVTRDNQAVGVSELKVGVSVMVDAGGDNEADLLAFEIRIVPPIARRK